MVEKGAPTRSMQTMAFRRYWNRNLKARALLQSRSDGRGRPDPFKCGCNLLLIWLFNKFAFIFLIHRLYDSQMIFGVSYRCPIHYRKLFYFSLFIRKKILNIHCSVAVPSSRESGNSNLQQDVESGLTTNQNTPLSFVYRHVWILNVYFDMKSSHVFTT